MHCTTWPKVRILGDHQRGAWSFRKIPSLPIIRIRLILARFRMKRRSVVSEIRVRESSNSLDGLIELSGILVIFQWSFHCILFSLNEEGRVTGAVEKTISNFVYTNGMWPSYFIKWESNLFVEGNLNCSNVHDLYFQVFREISEQKKSNTEFTLKKD